MKDENVEKGVKRFYHEQKLSPEMMEKLMPVAKTQKAITKPRWFANKVNLAMVASFTAIFFTAIQFAYIFKPAESDLILRVAQEVALNHNKQLATEFDADNYASLSTMMHQLDFDLKAPEHLMLASYDVLGARYCSIQGQIAGQIKLKDKAGKVLTLYITKNNEALSTLHNKTQERDNVLINNWQEDSLFFSLAMPR